MGLRTVLFTSQREMNVLFSGPEREGVVVVVVFLFSSPEREKCNYVVDLLVHYSQLEDWRQWNDGQSVSG